MIKLALKTSYVTLWYGISTESSKSDQLFTTVPLS